MPSIQLIWAHPRTDSLTARVVDAVRQELQQSGTHFTEVDLYRAGFDPVLHPADEPQWDNPDKRYSDAVMHQAATLHGKDAIVFVFPVWWYSVPAILKGYIDRVFNHGLAYGAGRRLGAKHWRWIALVGESQRQFTKRGVDQSMAHTLNVGVAGLCGGEDSQIVYLYDTLGEEPQDLPAHHAALIAQARQSVHQLIATLPTASSATPALPHHASAA